MLFEDKCTFAFSLEQACEPIKHWKYKLMRFANQEKKLFNFGAQLLLRFFVAVVSVFILLVWLNKVTSARKSGCQPKRFEKKEELVTNW